MAEAIRDKDHVTVGMGVNSDDNITPKMLTVDPVTNRLQISLTVDALTPTPASAVGRDQNHRPTYYGVDDDGNLVPIRTDVNGNLLLDLVLE